MTRILVVDDEPAQARGLLRAIQLRRPDYTVLTSDCARDAISILESTAIDLVLADLHMAPMSGFELLGWLMGNRPSVLGFALASERSDETCARLQELGSVELFVRPLDVDALLERVSDGLAQSMRGHLHNVGLASFLQLIELERKSCTLEVRSGDQVGFLFLRSGELLDARTTELSGEDAALAIVGWPSASISIEGPRADKERRIDKPIYHVLMEAMRVRDESSALRCGAGAGSELDPRPLADGRALLCEGALGVLRGEVSETECLACFARRSLPPVEVPFGSLALAVVDMATGTVLKGAARPGHNLAELAQSAHAVLRLELATVAAAMPQERLDEVVVMTRSRGELIHPLHAGDGFVLLVFDPGETNLVMARLELCAFLSQHGRP